MAELVADTSGLVSLAIAEDLDPDPLTLCFESYEVIVPAPVFEELEETATYNDKHGRAAQAVLDRVEDTAVESVELDDAFPLDDGENAAVTLANDLGAELLHCDEFRRLGLIHASLATTQLVTTPTLLAVFVRESHLTQERGIMALDRIVQGRSWENNSYVERPRSLLEG